MIQKVSLLRITITFLFTAIFSFALIAVNYNRTLSYKVVGKKARNLTLFQQYGNIEIFTTNDDTLYVEYFIKTDVPSIQDTSEIYYQVMVGVDTVKASKFSLDFAKSFIPPTDFNVSVKIYIPDSSNIKINTHFGDISASGYLDSFQVESEYSQISLDTLKNLSADIRFSGLNFGKVQNLWFKTENSNISGIHINNVSGNSEYSSVELDTIQFADIAASLGDKYVFGSIDSLVFAGNISMVSVESLQSYLEADFQKSEVMFVVSDSFKNVNLSLKEGELKLYLQEEGSYNFNAEARLGNINIIPMDSIEVSEDQYVKFYKGKNFSPDKYLERSVNILTESASAKVYRNSASE